MNGIFIYVFTPEEKDKLLSLGYQMIKSDNKNHIYAFENKDKLFFSKEEIKYVLSDTLTF